jgi:glycosyltransferase involved in cell wall biosynthesis
MAKELESIGLKVVLTPFKWVETRERIIPYGRLQALTYIPESRMDFYGWQQLKKLATDFPDVVFLVFGTQFCAEPFPKNILLQGWANESDFRREMEKSAIFLRLTAHDGYSVSVMEAVASGCEVLATQPFEKCTFITPQSSISEVFATVLKSIEDRAMLPNQDYIHFADKNYQREKVLTSYLQKLEELVK